jgi:hypothetical protein
MQQQQRLQADRKALLFSGRWKEEELKYWRWKRVLLKEWKKEHHQQQQQQQIGRPQERDCESLLNYQRRILQEYERGDLTKQRLAEAFDITPDALTKWSRLFKPALLQPATPSNPTTTPTVEVLTVDFKDFTPEFLQNNFRKVIHIKQVPSLFRDRHQLCSLVLKGPPKPKKGQRWKRRRGKEEEQAKEEGLTRFVDLEAFFDELVDGPETRYLNNLPIELHPLAQHLREKLRSIDFLLPDSDHDLFRFLSKNTERESKYWCWYLYVGNRLSGTQWHQGMPILFASLSLACRSPTRTNQTPSPRMQSTW